MTMSVNAMGYASTFAYDGSGQMTSEIDADGRTQSFGYDAMGHETSNVWYNGSGTQVEDIEFGYDPNGNMTLAQEVIGDSHELVHDGIRSAEPANPGHGTGRTDHGHVDAWAMTRPGIARLLARFPGRHDLCPVTIRIRN